MTDNKAIVINSDDEEEPTTIETTYDNPIIIDSDDNNSDSQTDTRADTIQTGASKKLYTLPYNIFERMIQENCKDMIPIRYHKKYREIWNIYCLYPTYRQVCNNIRTLIEATQEMYFAPKSSTLLFLLNLRKLRKSSMVRNNSLRQLYSTSHTSSMVLIWLQCRYPFKHVLSRRVYVHSGCTATKITGLIRSFRRKYDEEQCQYLLCEDEVADHLWTTIDVLAAGLQDIPDSLREVDKYCISELSINCYDFAYILSIIQPWWMAERELQSFMDEQDDTASIADYANELDITTLRNSVYDVGIRKATDTSMD